MLPGHAAARRARPSARAPTIGPDTTLTDCEVGAGAQRRAHPRRRAPRSAPARPSGRSPTCGRARASAPDGKIGTFVEIEERRRSATGSQGAAPVLRRRRRRSASTRTSARPRSSSTTTACDKHRTTIGSHVRTGSDNMFVAPVHDRRRRLHRRRQRDRATTCPRARWRCRRGPQRNIEGWVETHRPGTAARRTAAARAARAQPQAGTDDSRTTTRRLRTMSAIVGQHAKKNLMLFSGRAHPELAEEVAKHLGVELTPTSRVRLRQRRDLRPLRGVGPRLRRVRAAGHAAPINDLDHGAADHGRRAQAGLRQADHRRRCRSTATRARTRSTAAASRSRARLIADLFKTAGADRLMTVDLHTAQIQGFFDGPVDHLFALPLLADYVEQQRTTATSSPSSRPTPAGSGSPSVGGPLGGAPLAFIHKTPRPARAERGRREPGRRRGRGPHVRRSSTT